MTKLLAEAMRKITELSKERQDDAARVLMMMLHHDPEQYRLDDEQLEQVELAIADVDAGHFASRDDVDRTLRNAWT